MNITEKIGLFILIFSAPYFQELSGVKGLIALVLSLLGFWLFLYGKEIHFFAKDWIKKNDF